MKPNLPTNRRGYRGAKKRRRTITISDPTPRPSSERAVKLRAVFLIDEPILGLMTYGRKIYDVRAQGFGTCSQDGSRIKTSGWINLVWITILIWSGAAARPAHICSLWKTKGRRNSQAAWGLGERQLRNQRCKTVRIRGFIVKIENCHESRNPLVISLGNMIGPLLATISTMAESWRLSN